MTAPDGFTLRFRWSTALSVPVVWCLFFVSYQLPLPGWLALLLFAGYAAAVHRVYRDAAVELTLSRDDLRAAAVLAVIGFAAHWRTLFLPLGGDELYHAERSALLVKRLQALADFSVPLTHEWVQASMWRLHDVRFMPVADLWRAVSLALVATVALAAWLGLRAGRARGPLATAALVAFGALGLWVRWAPEPHPPLRLLPWFASQTLLGLSDFAFRVPALLLALGASLLVYKAALHVRALTTGAPAEPADRRWALALALGIQFLPVVLYVSDTVEASAFALVVWISVLVLGHLVVVDAARAPEFLRAAGVVTGLGALLRQTTVLLWLLVGALYLFQVLRRRSERPLALGLQVFGLGPLALPYFASVAAIGHVAAGEGGSAAQKLWSSLISGIGPMAVLNSNTLPWLVFVLLLAARLVATGAARAVLPCLLAVPAYVLFHAIWPFLWGMGRYQAEYVAPFLALVLFLTAARPPSAVAARRAVGAALLLLGAYSVDLNSRLDLDTNYAEWPRMRITTSAYYPYDQAIRHLKRADAHGHFALLGGSPWYGDVVVWTNGYDFTEARIWRDSQEKLARALRSPPPSAQALAQRLFEGGLRYLVVQRGSRREEQHRTDRIRAAIELVDSAPAHFPRDLSFTDRFGGVLDVHFIRP